MIDVSFIPRTEKEVSVRYIRADADDLHFLYLTERDKERGGAMETTWYLTNEALLKLFDAITPGALAVRAEQQVKGEGECG